MTATRWLWAVFTVAAAFAQTIRNAMLHELTAALGTAGATQVRFLFGFPFALVFLAILVAKTGAPLPRPGLMFWARVLAGAFTQILATALMLAAMGERSFVVTIAFGFYGRARRAILVSCLRAGDRGERANAGTGGSSIRAARRALWLWPTHDGARGNRHGLCRVRRGAFVVGVLNASSAPGKGAP